MTIRPGTSCAVDTRRLLIIGLFRARNKQLYATGRLTYGSRWSQLTRVSSLCANADVRQVANEIPGNALGLTYVIDPRAQGTITLRTARPLKRSDAIGVLEDVLAMNGAALVRDGDICLGTFVPLGAVLHRAG